MPGVLYGVPGGLVSPERNNWSCMLSSHLIFFTLYPICQLEHARDLFFL
jgi:hypothetical protein